MSMRNGSWDGDRRWSRDAEREPSNATSRRTRQLNAGGTLRLAHEQAQAARPMCVAGTTSADGSSLHLCKLADGHAGPHVFPNVGSREWGANTSYDERPSDVDADLAHLGLIDFGGGK